MTALVDTHAHLHDPAFDDDRDVVLSRARDAGVGTLITVGTDLETSALAAGLAAEQPDAFAVVGVHPHDAKTWNPAARETLGALARQPGVVAIGEIGLDFFRNLSPPDEQRAAFEAQLDLADELELPVVIHSRDAHEETRETLERWAATTPVTGPRGVLHCFSGDLRLAAAYAELGFLISFAGPVTYPKNDLLRAAAAGLPSEAMVVETDCPYLSPQGRRGKRNEPAYVIETATLIAELRGEEFSAFAGACTANSVRLFRLPVDARIVAGTAAPGEARGQT